MCIRDRTRASRPLTRSGFQAARKNRRIPPPGPRRAPHTPRGPGPIRCPPPPRRRQLPAPRRQPRRSEPSAKSPFQIRLLPVSFLQFRLPPQAPPSGPAGRHTVPGQICAPARTASPYFSSTDIFFQTKPHLPSPFSRTIRNVLSSYTICPPM